MFQIPLSRLEMGQEEIEACAEVLRSGWLIQGDQVERFEEAVQEATGAAYAVAVYNGTCALHLALLLAGVGRGDEVILPSYTFVACVEGILQLGATPVFVDIDRSFNVDPEDLAKRLTPRTRAVMVVHQFGLPADLERIEPLVEEAGAVLIEDAACALGSRYKGRPIGQRGSLVTLSFHPRKVVTTAEGGALLTNNSLYDLQARRLRTHGMDIDPRTRHRRGAGPAQYVLPGYNYRMSDIHAAIGLVQMQRLEGFIEERRRLAARYDQLLSSLPHLSLPPAPPHAESNYQSYPLWLDSPSLQEQALASLRQKGIGAQGGLVGIHRIPYLQQFLRHPLPRTEEAEQSSLLLPLFPGLSHKEQDFIVDSLADVLSQK